jgi:hypothetical protein
MSQLPGRLRALAGDCESTDGWETAAPDLQAAATLIDELLLKVSGVDTFQARVHPWLLACFGEVIAGDCEERNHRFLEEALELVQSLGCTAGEAHQLVDYVYGREIGQPMQEVGGVMVTLAALCRAGGLDMHSAGEIELARIWTKVEDIRAKQAAKPKHSPLPQDVASRTAPKCQKVPPFDITKPKSLPQDAAFALEVLKRFSDGVGPFTPGDARCMSETIEQLFAQIEHQEHVIDRDRYVVAHCVGAIETAARARTWLLEGRGPYEWDDDRYREEFGDALRSIEQAAQPLKIVGWDKSDCTLLEERVNAAKLAAKEMLAQPPGPRAMIWADIFGDPRDARVAELEAALASRTVNVASTDGYRDAFYDIAKLLNIGARADSPANVWRKEMLPKLQALVLQRDEALAQARASVINSPETVDFVAGVPIEAAHQRERWGAEHDAGKSPFDWFWLIGYLAQKAADAATRGDHEKALHHTISTGAALANWHAAIAGKSTSMRPGIEPPGHVVRAARGEGDLSRALQAGTGL